MRVDPARRVIEGRGQLLMPLELRDDGSVVSGAPTGTVTFLFTDIEGSTRLWQDHGEAMTGALARHDEVLRAAIEGHRGVVFSTAGDSFAAAFWTPDEAVDAAITAQASLLAETWPVPITMRVRMGVHTVIAAERDGNYFGPTLNRAARLMAAGHGGQVLLSDAAAALARQSLPAATALLDLGVH